MRLEIIGGGLSTIITGIVQPQALLIKARPVLCVVLRGFLTGYTLTTALFGDK